MYVGRSTLEISVASAVIQFNDGKTGMIDVLHSLGILPGHFTKNGFQNSDVLREKLMDIKSSEKFKKQRKKLRATRKGFDDKHNDEEGTLYERGGGGFNLFSSVNIFVFSKYKVLFAFFSVVKFFIFWIRLRELYLSN